MSRPGRTHSGRTRPGGRYRLRALAGAGLGCALLAGLAAGHFGGSVAGWAGILPELVRQAGPLGWAVFMLAQAAVAMVGIVPASLLGVMAGMTYGVGAGFLLSAAGTLAGGWGAFLLSRSLLRSWVAARLAHRASALRLDEAVGREGWRLVCLLRMSPVMPFAVTSYALGLTQIGWRDYALGTLAALPALLGYVAVGALARAGLAAPPGEQGWFRLGLVAFGIAATLLLVLRLGRLLAACGLLPRRAPAPPPAILPSDALERPGPAA